MAFGFDPTTLNIDGVNFSDYILDKNSYNPLVFIHKKCYTKGKQTKVPEGTFNFRNTYDKCLQYDHEKQYNGIKTKIIDNSDQTDPVLQQTIKFAKDIIPLTIPATSAEPVYYTIKSKKSSKRKHDACHHNVNPTIQDATFDKGKTKLTEIIKHDKLKLNKTTISTDESVSRSSQNNTMDDVNENKSLSYTLSEISEENRFKKERRKQTKYRNQKITPSESFEAIATEYMNISNEANIKMHLMNEKEKKLFCENVTSPVVTAVKECFSALEDRDNEIKNIFSAIENQAIRLDKIFNKLSNIENKLETITNTETKNNNTFQEINCSKLEELGKDIVNVKEYLSSEEELAYVDLKIKNHKAGSLSTVHRTNSTSKVEKFDNLARGENISGNFKATLLGTELERPNRIPARFCWTDTVKKP